MLPFAFAPDASIDDYVEYALDVPMYFIIRNGEYVEMHPTFRQFLASGWGSERATLEDWALHLTTLFPEVRLKRYLEIRSADSQPPEMMLALPALLKGVLYERDALDGAWDLVKSWSWPERLAIYKDAHREGLHARVRRIALVEIARELVEIAAAGLRRQNQCNEKGEDERIYLERMVELVRDGKSLGRSVAELWDGPWNRDVARLIAHTTYRLPQ
jgi:glutamate--cysteine ligase